MEDLSYNDPGDPGDDSSLVMMKMARATTVMTLKTMTTMLEPIEPHQEKPHFTILHNVPNIKYHCAELCRIVQNYAELCAIMHIVYNYANFA